MIHDSRVLLVVGSSLTAFLMWALYHWEPTPGELSVAHSQIVDGTNLASCQVCHQPEGLTAGCLSCHDEIGAQLDEKRGYHEFLSRDEGFRCSECHGEHHGPRFPLVNNKSWGGNPQDFDHPHVTFDLVAAHEGLSCDECHKEERRGRIAVSRFPEIERAHSFLGLSQQCGTCHDDPHAGGRVQDCERCHGQQEFDPPQHFDHSAHFPFIGKHANRQCVDCHELPHGEVEESLLFDQVRGRACQECHQSPHQFDFGTGCETCHGAGDPEFHRAKNKMTAARHAHTGFELVAPHDQVSCEKCHDPQATFAERHPDPTAQGYLRTQESCQGCHEDVHRGQFKGRHERCLDCHDRHAFQPPTFGREQHQKYFPLSGSHESLDCDACHEMDPVLGAREFVGTARSCRLCHEDPHAGQFEERVLDGDCITCHKDDSSTFSIRPFDHLARTGFNLEGAHEQVECKSCHQAEEFHHQGQTVHAARFVGTPRECISCHGDVHGGQFEGRYANCFECHDPHFFKPTTFSHEDHARLFPLNGAHKATACSECHGVDPGTGIRLFNGQPSSCAECHGDPHAGQFQEEIEQGDCTTCHSDQIHSFRIRPFDHLDWSDFPLEGGHSRARCNDCHVESDIVHGGETHRARRYVGTPTECADCHEDVHAGQFESYASCAMCHVSLDTFKAVRFDHDTQSRFPLEGRHRELDCAACHRPVQEDHKIFVRYRPMGTECRDCHEIDPRVKDAPDK